MIVNSKFEKDGMVFYFSTLVDNQSKEFLKKELERIRNKIEKLHEKSGYEERRYKFEKILSQIRALKIIEEYLTYLLEE